MKNQNKEIVIEIFAVSNVLFVDNKMREILLKDLIEVIEKLKKK